MLYATCVVRVTLLPPDGVTYKLSSDVGDAETPSGGVCDIAFKSDSSRNEAADERCMSQCHRRELVWLAKAYCMQRTPISSAGDPTSTRDPC